MSKERDTRIVRNFAISVAIAFALMALSFNAYSQNVVVTTTTSKTGADCCSLACYQITMRGLPLPFYNACYPAIPCPSPGCQPFISTNWVNAVIDYLVWLGIAFSATSAFDVLRARTRQAKATRLTRAAMLKSEQLPTPK